jgi:formiminotetrahydrofolate cyclodeaminase
MARAAVRGALLNVRINLRGLRDPAFAAETAARAQALEARAQALEEEIFRHVRL